MVVSVSTLGDLCRDSEFDLRPVGALATADRMVDAVCVLTEGTWPDELPAEVGDALVVVGLPKGLGFRSADASTGAFDRLLAELARQRAAGLAVCVGHHGPQAVPAMIRNSASRMNVPLLMTTKSAAEWRGLAARFREHRFLRAEWHADQLTALLNRLPHRLAEPGEKASQRIVDWLSAALDAEVLVSSPHQGVLAAAPNTAAEKLALLLTGRATRPQPFGAPEDPTPNTRVFPLDPWDPTTVLWVVSCQAFDEARTDLAQHAAKALGLIEQAKHQYRVEEARRAVNQAAFQLLLLGETVGAQRVLAKLAPGLLTTEQTRVYVIDCADNDREPTLRRAEEAVAGRALLARCPAYNHLLVADPLHQQDHDPENVRAALTRVVAALPQHWMGSSRVRPLGETADAYAEAAAYLAMARHAPDRVARVEERAHFVDALPPEPARRWAGAVLRPLLGLPTAQRDQLLHTLELGLEVQHKAVSRLLGIHRNTVTHRITRCFRLVGLDRHHVMSKVVVSAALKIMTAHGYDDAGTDPASDFTEMMTAPDVRSWAEAFLEPLKEVGGDLLPTLGVWMENNTDAEHTAAALSMSPAAVRARLRTATPLMRREMAPGLVADRAPDGDEHGLSGLRPLAFALYASTGLPATLAAPPVVPE
ncbi:helix-turn-helix domain-containing protein [Streptomyces sp. NPDC002913]